MYSFGIFLVDPFWVVSMDLEPISSNPSYQLNINHLIPSTSYPMKGWISSQAMPLFHPRDAHLWHFRCFWWDRNAWIPLGCETWDRKLTHGDHVKNMGKNVVGMWMQHGWWVCLTWLVGIPSFWIGSISSFMVHIPASYVICLIPRSGNTSIIWNQNGPLREEHRFWNSLSLDSTHQFSGVI